ncbi:MAG: UDP-N-acetylmuramate dehydrogenase, partial [Saprospiraceae bacterium]|nr:UDP-N-acetylmuramate dehydrogenase [Saprospiraceae bacterium]
LAGATRSPFVLGGGSNLLLTRDIDQLVLLNEIGGIEVVRESSNFVDVRIGGGVVWHDFVQWAVDRQLGGVENLALIPGKVGAAPIQNIGAYGVELTSVFRGLEAMQLETRERAIFDHAQCRFGYRDSIFKRELKGKYCITTVTLRLSRAPHMIEDSYGAIRQTLQDQGIGQPGIAQIFEAVVAIRSSKLPDPAVLGNSGSFFKNPVVPEAQWRSIKHEWPDLVYYPDREGFYKIPAGWLIDQCGWKGKRIGNVGCYEKQALVIVNYGSASGQEVLDHAMRVRASVKERFGIELTPEVNIL